MTKSRYAHLRNLAQVYHVSKGGQVAGEGGEGNAVDEAPALYTQLPDSMDYHEFA